MRSSLFAISPILLLKLHIAKSIPERQNAFMASQSHIHSGRKLLALVEGEVSEHIVDLATARKVVAYAEISARG